MSLAVKHARAASQGTMRGPVQQGGLGGFLKGVARGAAGFLVGGPAGAAAAAFGPSLTGGSGGFAGPPPQVRPPLINPPFAGPPGAGVAFPGGRLSFREGLMQPGTKLACPSGHRPNKTSYFLRDGTFVPEGSRCVKIRRRNPLNPRAADRAISRITSAKKAASKLSRVTIRKKKC